MIEVRNLYKRNLINGIDKLMSAKSCFPDKMYLFLQEVLMEDTLFQFTVVLYWLFLCLTAVIFNLNCTWQLHNHRVFYKVFIHI